MGFFSWDCEGCKHSARSEHSIGKTSSKWMAQIVILFERNPRYGLGGPIIEKGEYDGYGRFAKDDENEDRNLADEEPFTIYHEACYKILGSPKKFTVQSKYARDQGYFIEFNPPEPKTKEDLEDLLDFHRTEEVLKA